MYLIPKPISRQNQKLTQQNNWRKNSSSPREAWAGSSSPREASVYVSTRIRKMPVWEIFRKLALIPGNVGTYPKVCVGKRLEYRKKSLKIAKNR